jgi:hypothetical protein
MAAKNEHRNGRKETRGVYVDGHPFDTVHYFQAKLLLKADRLASVERFHDFGRLADRTARTADVGVIPDPDTSRPPRVREVIFVDTSDFRLYTHGYILRRRIAYVDGFPKGDPEIVFKFRDPDLRSAAALDVRPRIEGKYRIKFKEQVLPLDNRIGGYRVLYSHNCEFGVSQVRERDRTRMSTLVRVFPLLGRLKASTEERVQLVNEGIVEELQLPLARLDFGKGIVAKSNVTLWRTRGTHVPLIGEYSFQVKCDRREDVPGKSTKLAKQFFTALQHDVEGWMLRGTTKTELVYRLNGNSVQRHE